MIDWYSKDNNIYKKDDKKDNETNYIMIRR